MIRVSVPADVPHLFSIWKAAVRATHDFLSAEDFGAITAMVRDEYLPAAEFWVFEREGRVTGFMGMTGANIDSLFVDPEVHGSGVGRALVAHAAAMHPALSVDVNEQNAGAAAFYRRLGFVIVGRSPVDDAGRRYPLLHLARGSIEHPAVSA